MTNIFCHSFGLGCEQHCSVLCVQFQTSDRGLREADEPGAGPDERPLQGQQPSHGRRDCPQASHGPPG